MYQSMHQLRILNWGLAPLMGGYVDRQVYGSIWGRHGDRTVKGSTAFPGIHQLVGLVVVHAPHLEIHPDTVVKAQVPVVGIGVLV